MRVRISFARGPLVHQGRLKNVPVLQAGSALLTPVSIACVLMGVWKVGSDMEWAEPFAITRGIFSHFQVWFALGAGVQALSWRFARYGRDQEELARAGNTDDSPEPPKARAASAS